MCHKPFHQPVQNPSGKVVCQSCVEQTSRNDFTPLTADPSILQALDQILVKCQLCHENHLERRNFANHLMKLCPKAIVACSKNENKCPWIGLRAEFANHADKCLNQPSISDEDHGQFLSFSKIHFQERHFPDQDLAIAVKAFLINKRSTCLDLFNKKLSSKGASIIASVLPNDTLLEMLSLRNNLICDSGVQYLSHALTSNTFLKRLDLNGNSITDTGVRLLSEMLKSNQTLIKLTLSYNRITNEGMTILADVLINSNSTLQWLCLTGNVAIDDLSIHSIRNLIRHNQSLTTLNLEQCSLSWWHKKQISMYQTIYFKSHLNILL